MGRFGSGSRLYLLNIKLDMIIVVICSVFINSNVFAKSNQFCDSLHNSKEFLSFKKMQDEKLVKFSNMKLIAAQADDILSKLITAKSPVFSGWLQRANLSNEKDEKIIQEWRKYYALNFVLNEYPKQDSQLNTEIEKFFKDLNKSFATPLYKKKMNLIFEKSREASLKVISSLKIDEAQKKQIKTRVENIKLYWMEDFKNSKFKNHPLEFLEWGVAYDPVSNEINLGLNSMIYPNDETIMAVFAHEIAHSFDSCRWGAYFDGAWPFISVGECLRSTESIGALKRDDSQMENLVKNKKINSEMAHALKLNATCNKSFYPPQGLQQDQLPESFSDWFSAEAMLTVKDLNVSKLRSDLCQESQLMTGSSYVSNESRLNGIYFAAPQFRSKREDLKNIKIKYCQL